MRRYLIPLVALFALSLSGCASSSGPAARKPKQPFPGPMNFAGDYDRAPTPRFMPLTVFPPFLIERGESGSATIVFKVKPDGYVEEAKVESATEPAFGSSALGTVGRMVFVPASKAGKPVGVVGRVTFPFSFE
jgi:TonB family protein